MWATLTNTDYWIFWMWFAVYWSVLGVIADILTKNFGWDRGYNAQTAAVVQTTKFLEKLAKKRGYKRIAKQAIQAIQDTTQDRPEEQK